MYDQKHNASRCLLLAAEELASCLIYS